MFTCDLLKEENLALNIEREKIQRMNGPSFLVIRFGGEQRVPDFIKQFWLARGVIRRKTPAHEFPLPRARLCPQPF